MSKSIPAVKSQNFVNILGGQKPTWVNFLEFEFFYLKRQGYIAPAGFELACSQFTICEAFWQFPMSFCIFSKNCESLKSDTSWIFRVIHWTSYIVSYFKPIKYPLLNNNLISQKFIVHINFKLHASFFSNYHFITI